MEGFDHLGGQVVKSNAKGNSTVMDRSFIELNWGKPELKHLVELDGINGKVSCNKVEQPVHSRD